MPDPISITVSESNALPGASVTVTLASTPVTLYGSSVAVTVANSALASGAGKTIVSSGGIADLTSAQQLEVSEGTIVLTADGYRYIYSGSGSKTNPASYVILADITPDWSSLSGKPSTFAPSAHAASHGSAGADAITVAISQVTGLQTALDGKQASGSYVLTTDSRLSDSREWSASTVTQAEAEAGTSTSRVAYTPQRVFQAVASWWDGSAAKTKLDGIESGATANATDADLRDRTTHTGVQAISTVDGLQDALDGKATAAHFHGNIDNNGAIGTTSGHIVVTTTGGALTTTPTISSGLIDGLALVAVTGAYSDLSGTPAAYSLPTASSTVLGGVKIGSGLAISSGTVSADVTSVAGRTGAVTIAAADVSGLAASATTDTTNAGNISSGTLGIARIPTGSTSTTVCIGNDARLSDSRAPTAHKSSHATGGSDALSPSDIGAASSSHTHAASDITSGTLATARLGSGTPDSMSFLAGNSTWKTFAFIPGYEGFADADDWASRVTTNGGSVSTDTMTAMYKFCMAIAAAGARDRFIRLNMFAGTGLASCLVPLYRGRSRTGTQYGNTTDTNSNFVSGDYTETGSSGGLAGSRAATKRLDTGVACSTFSGFNFHASAYEIVGSDTTYDSSLGAWNTAANAGFYVGTSDVVTKYEASVVNNGLQATQTAIAGHYIFTQTGNRVGFLLGAGTQLTASYAGGANLISDWSSVTWSITVYTLQQGSASYANYSSSRLGSYSFGLSMTAAQASAFYAAMQAFQTSLGRAV